MIPHYNTMFWTNCDECGSVFRRQNLMARTLSDIEDEMKREGWVIYPHARTIRCKDCAKKKGTPKAASKGGRK